MPEGATHWSTRSMTAECGLSPATVQRVWRAFGLKPHRTEGFKLSSDPAFAPFAYFKDVLERVVTSRTKAHQLDELLPWQWKVERLAAAVNA
jgi:IS66 C-terminal element